jgi:serine/threonine protein kinase
MSTKAVGVFVKLLRDSQLLSSSQVEELKALSAVHGDDMNRLAKDIYKRGWLTRYQLNEVANGRAKDLILGAYRLLEPIGEGGMGQVYKAVHQPMDRVVALKVIRKERLSNEKVVKRFYREIQLVGHLSHPNIVVAFDAGQAGSKLYYAMEYLDGIDLAALVTRSGPLPVAQACDFIRQAALGLQHAHERGMVHRDVKPHNLIATRLSTDDGKANARAVVKILDLGLARLGSGEADNTVTQDGQGLGTPAYLAPEQARNARTADIRADIYSLGCTLYHLLTGVTPFQGELAAVLLKHQMEEAPPVESLRSEVPPGVAAIMRKMMAKRPEDRFQTPAEVAEALQAGTFGSGQTPVSEGLDWTVLLEGGPGHHAETVNTDTFTPQTVTAARRTKEKFGVARSTHVMLFVCAGVIAVLLAVSVGAAVFFMRPGSQPTETKQVELKPAVKSPPVAKKVEKKTLAPSVPLIAPAPAPPGEVGANIALGKSVLWNREPNYKSTKDPDDALQLTDGDYCAANQNMWLHKSAVGWEGRSPVILTIDLTAVFPIQGVSFSTAANKTANVTWPEWLGVATSDDGMAWVYHGDLRKLSSPPGSATGSVYHRFSTNSLRTHGRYVAIMASFNPYLFCDEIEVFRGPAALLTQAVVGDPIPSLEDEAAGHPGQP